MHLWFDLVSVAQSISFTDEEDNMIWELHSSGLYNVQSLYAVVNFRDVLPIHVPAICKLIVPPRIHLFFFG